LTALCRNCGTQSGITEETGRRLRLALSPGSDPAYAAAWLEGWLRGSGLLLLHDEALWTVLDAWLAGLGGEAFVMVLPLLRRAFAAFPPAERRQLGELAAARVGRRTGTASDPAAVDVARTDAVLPLLAAILGLSPNVAEALRTTSLPDVTMGIEP